MSCNQELLQCIMLLELLYRPCGSYHLNFRRLLVRLYIEDFKKTAISRKVNAVLSEIYMLVIHPRVLNDVNANNL